MRGYIFPCSNETMPECLGKNLFGTTKDKERLFKYLNGEDYIFLYNFSTKKLYGIWKPTSKIGLYDKTAWDGRFRCQLKVRLFSNNYIELDIYKLKSEINLDPSKEIIISEDKVHKLLDLFSKENNLSLSRLKLPENTYRVEAEIVCKDGHKVRSRGEKIIDDWFFDNNIKHVYEPTIIEIPERLKPDWCLYTKDNGLKVYVEYWGLEDYSQYKEAMKRKLEIYMKYNLPLIEIRNNDINDLDRYLPPKLRKFKII